MTNTFEISRLNAKDFEEAIDFINMVFSMNDAPTNFIKLLPAYYEPTEESMKCHHVIRTEGKIRALVGIYPGKLIVGNSVLRVARIGAVSTHPYYRERGMMQELLGHCVNLIKEEGYDLGFLGGLRHRYLYFGYEKCGHRLQFQINKSNVKHCGVSAENIEIRKITEENASLTEYYKALHDRQEIHFSRSKKDFYKLCLNWNNKLYGILKQGIPAGYLVANENGEHISELQAENPEISIEAVIAFAAQSGSEKVTLDVSPLDFDLCHRLGKISEVPQVRGVLNWSVYNWESVVTAFLKAKVKKLSLQEGRVIMGIKDYGNLSISVTNGTAVCERTQEPSVIEIDSSTAARLLFGPLPPYLVMNLPKEASILNNWCPLPLCMSEQDFA